MTHHYIIETRLIDRSLTVDENHTVSHIETETPILDVLKITRLNNTQSWITFIREGWKR